MPAAGAGEKSEQSNTYYITGNSRIMEDYC
jgi:hypothetical protein